MAKEKWRKAYPLVFVRVYSAFVGPSVRVMFGAIAHEGSVVAQAIT